MVDGCALGKKSNKVAPLKKNKNQIKIIKIITEDILSILRLRTLVYGSSDLMEDKGNFFSRGKNFVSLSAWVALGGPHR